MASAKDEDEIYFIDKKYRDKIKEYKLINDEIIKLELKKSQASDIKVRLETMDDILKKEITPDMITPEIMDSFVYSVLVLDKTEIIFLIDVNHTYSIKEVSSKRKEILKIEPSYQNTVHVKRPFRPEVLHYKVVLI